MIIYQISYIWWGALHNTILNAGYLYFVYKVPYRRARALGRVRRASKGILHTNLYCSLARRTRPKGQARRATIGYIVYKIKLHSAQKV